MHSGIICMYGMYVGISALRADFGANAVGSRLISLKLLFSITIRQVGGKVALGPEVLLATEESSKVPRSSDSIILTW